MSPEPSLEKTQTNHERLCPSAQCAPGAILLGVVGSDHRVGYLTPAIPVSEAFVAQAEAGRRPERRFRFAQPCMHGRCQFWDDGRCSVAKAASAQVPRREQPPSRLPRCAIRPKCLWFHQEGERACRACPYVVTDIAEAREAQTGPSATVKGLGGEDA
jgi:hypothetical protein